MNKIFLKSCEKMDEIQDGKVDLIITSPPYWNAIDYDVHVSDNTKWFRTRKGDEYEKYLEWLNICFKECYRVLKPGRFCCVVIGTVLCDGKHYPLPHHFISLMENIGYEFHQDIIWYKVTGGVKRAGVTIQNPYPGYYCPNIMTEYILIFRKPGPKIYKDKTKEEKEKSKIPMDDLFTKELANNIWHIAPVPPNQYDHPCPFPEEIPYRLIGFFSYPGDLVLDPFLGIGTTIKVANRLNRKWMGYEIKEKYIKTAERRLNEPLYLRGQLISIFEKIPVNENSIKLLRRTKIKEYILESSQQRSFEFILKEKKYKYKTRTKQK
ncbi:MAG: site-specific DNA-methyltransferase [Nitrospirota bacterium]